MTFRSIGELAFEMLAKLEIDGTATRGSNVRASGRSTAVKGVARPAGGQGGTNRTRHALAGEEVNPAAQFDGIKGGEETVGLTELPPPTRGVFATGNGVRLIYSNTCMPRHVHTTPHRGLGIHLRLVAGH